MRFWRNTIIVAALLASGSLLGQDLSIHHGLNGEVLIEVGEREGVTYRLEKSSNWKEWFSDSDPWVETKAFKIDSHGSEALFYRLQTWETTDDPIIVGLLGDSTVVDFSFWDGTFGGWGEGLPDYIGPDVRIANMAQPGESTRTFLETSWRVKNLQLVSPDFVLIQYGMIDEIASEPEKLTTFEAYEENLETLIQLVRNFGGTPILITPPAKRAYGPDGKVVDWLSERSAIVLKVASRLHCPSVDLNSMTRDYFNEKGNSATRELTTDDRLHYKITGAQVLAGMVAASFPGILTPYLNSKTVANRP